MATKPLPRKQRIINRGYLYSRTDDDIKTPSVTLMDMDSAIKFYFENVIKPSIDGKQLNVMVLCVIKKDKLLHLLLHIVELL